EGDRPGPDRRAADGSEGAGVGGPVVQVEDVHAAAVGAGQQRVGRLVQLQVAHLDVGQPDAEALPGGGPGGQQPDAVLGARVQGARARVDDQLVDRQVGQVAGDVVPGQQRAGAVRVPAGGRRFEDLADGVELVAGDIDRVAVRRVHLDVREAALGRQVAGPVLP